MDGTVALTDISGNNEELITLRIPMPQKRWPHITTSVSGISPEDWEMFKDAAIDRNMSYREAMEHAIADLIADIRSGKEIDWQPSRSAPSKPIKIHAETVDQVRDLCDRIGYRQNVIFGTAMMRWIEKG